MSHISNTEIVWHFPHFFGTVTDVPSWQTSHCDRSPKMIELMGQLSKCPIFETLKLCLKKKRLNFASSHNDKDVSNWVFGERPKNYIFLFGTLGLLSQQNNLKKKFGMSKRCFIILWLLSQWDVCHSAKKWGNCHTISVFQIWDIWTAVPTK